MRICLLTPEFPPYVAGGIATYVCELARGYAGRGHEVTVAGFRIHPEPRLVHDWGVSLSFGADRPLECFARIKKAIPYIWRFSRLWNPCDVALAYFLGASTTRQFLRERAERFDIVEIPNYPGHGGLLPRCGVPYVVRLSTPACDCGGRATRLATWLEARACHRADLVVANSHAMLAKATATYGLAPERMAVIYHGLPDIELVGESPSTDHLEVLYMGRAEPRKGFDLLIRALAVVLPECLSLRFTVVGCDADLFASQHGTELKELWSNLRRQYPDRLIVTGRVDESEKIRRLAGAHWLVVPSRFESFGLVAVEAMRAGTPVLAADVGGLSEVARLGPGNIRFSHSDATALADALRLACGLGPRYALGLRDATREAYMEHFHADLMVDRSLELYANLCGTPVALQPSFPLRASLSRPI